MRLWQVNFQIYRKLDHFPYPGDLVEEIQDSPTYYMSGSKRAFGGAQLVFTVEGVGGLKLGKNELRLKPGMAFLANHDDPKHAYYYPPESQTPWVFFWIAFFGGQVEKMVSSMNTRYGYIYNLEKDQGIIKQLYAYQSYRNTVQVLSPLDGAKLVMDILSALAKKKEKELVQEPQSKLVREAQQLILQQMKNNLGIAEIAENLSVSREHLSRVFKEQTGISPLEFMQHSKIRFACHLLRENQFTCQEIANRIGYENISTFNRAFKRIVKMSPTKYKSQAIPLVLV